MCLSIKLLLATAENLHSFEAFMSVCKYMYVTSQYHQYYQ